jgi:molecular chaperone HtpG
LTAYKDKPLKAADKGEQTGEEVAEDVRKRFQPFLDYLKAILDEVKDVRVSNRLKESAACLVSDEAALGPHVELLMRRMGRSGEIPELKRVLELNPTHPAVEAVRAVFDKDPSDERLAKHCRILYDQAVIAEGARVKDPAVLARYINELLVKDAAS